MPARDLVMRVVVLVAAAFSAAGLLSATAQQPAAGVAATQAEAQKSLESYVSRSKLTLVAPIQVGSLRDGGEQRFTVEAPAGVRLSVRGSCDNACDDIDLEIFDAEGRPVGSDVEDDGVPSVTLQPVDHPRKLAINLIMNRCFHDACGVAMGVFKPQ
jgi:hypothetical protein